MSWNLSSQGQTSTRFQSFCVNYLPNTHRALYLSYYEVQVLLQIGFFQDVNVGVVLLVSWSSQKMQFWPTGAVQTDYSDQSRNNPRYRCFRWFVFKSFNLNVVDIGLKSPVMIQAHLVV